MKTSELIAGLAAAAPVRPARPAARLIVAGMIGAGLALALVAILLGFQPIALALRASWFWMKAGYSLSLALAGLLLLAPLARPGARPPLVGFVVAVLAVGFMGMMAAHASMRVPADQRPALWLGDTWRVCSWRILGLAAPVFLALVVGLRRLAPTRPRLTGAAAGLAAGGLSAVVYGFYCQESAAPFVAAWYSLGVAVSAIVGAWLGPRLLRW